MDQKNPPPLVSAAGLLGPDLVMMQGILLPQIMIVSPFRSRKLEYAPESNSTNAFRLGSKLGSDVMGEDVRRVSNWRARIIAESTLARTQLLNKIRK